MHHCFLLRTCLATSFTDNGVQCVALRTSAQPVAAAWAGGGAAGLAATASVRNTRFALACSLTCATAAAGVELLRGGNE